MAQRNHHPDPESAIAEAREALNAFDYGEAEYCPHENWVHQLAHACDEVKRLVAAVRGDAIPAEREYQRVE